MCRRHGRRGGHVNIDRQHRLPGGARGKHRPLFAGCSGSAHTTVTLCVTNAEPGTHPWENTATQAPRDARRRLPAQRPRTAAGSPVHRNNCHPALRLRVRVCHGAVGSSGRGAAPRSSLTKQKRRPMIRIRDVMLSSRNTCRALYTGDKQQSALSQGKT